MGGANFEKNDERASTAAVIGGSGFIGSYLVLNLLQMGLTVHLLSNQTDPGFVSARGRIKIVKGSIENELALAECFERCDVVYHLVGIIAETKNKTFEKTVVGGTGKAVSAARSRGVRKIIYLSALGTGKESEARYFQSKYQSEKLIIESGLDYTIFRPSIVYGVEDQFINRIARMVKYLPFIPVIGDGQYRLQPVYVEELAALMTDTLRREFTSRKIYEIGGPEQLTYLEMVDIIKRVLRRKRGKIYIPFSFARLMAALMENFLKPAPLTVDQLKMMKAGFTCDHTVAEREFGVKFTPLETQLQKYLGKMYGKGI